MDQTENEQVTKDPFGGDQVGRDPASINLAGRDSAGRDLAGRDRVERDRVGSNQAELTSSVGSIWQLKPWWCQPWSILLTGVAMILASWLVLHRLWITAPLSCVVLLWWLLFLVVVPASYRQQFEFERPTS
jgi:hypothetical protein